MAPAVGWELDNVSFRLYDGSANDYGAPSGAGVTTEFEAATGNAFFRGDVVASRIHGPLGGSEGTGARMWLDFTAWDQEIAPAGASAGVSPYWAITDDNSLIRVEAGYLAARNNSPQQWGMRVNNEAGAPIFDSLGLISVMQLLGKSTFSGGSIAGTSSAQEIADGGLSFTLARESMVLVFAVVNLTLTSAGAPSALADLTFDHRFVGGGFYSFPSAIAIATGTQIPVVMVGLSGRSNEGGFPGPLPAGDHSINMRLTSPPATTVAWDPNGGMIAFTLGRSG